MILDGVMVGLFALSLARWLLTLTAALSDWARRRRRPLRVFGDAELPPVSVVVPAFNEEKVIEATLCALARSDYPGLEIVVVDDGSTDRTFALASATAVPGLRVLRQPTNSGKARALARGVREARGSVIVTTDADTQVAPDAIRRLVEALLDSDAAAAAGNVKVGNRDRALTRWQALEYVTSLQFERRAQARLSCITTVPGALAAFRREALAAAGSFSSDTLAEDTDLTLSLARAGARRVFADRAVAWTEAPSSAGALLRQRVRWLRGNLQCAFKHRRAFLEPGQPGLRLYGLPSFWYGHLFVPLLLPLCAAYCLRLLSWLSPLALVLGLAPLLAIDAVTALLGVRMDRERWWLVLYVPLQRFVFPFFLFAAFVRVCASALAGAPHAWNRVERSGGWRIAALPAETVPPRAG